MLRIILPALLLAAVVFSPLSVYSGTGTSPKGDQTTFDYSPASMVQPTRDCVVSGRLTAGSFFDECAASEGLEGKAYAATAVIALVAAVLGVVGLLPFLGRLTAFFPLLAGIVGLGATGMSGWEALVANSQALDPGLGLGAVGGLSLLNLAAGFAGVRGDDE